MGFHSKEHVAKTAEHVGPDCLSFKGTSQGTHSVLGDRDAEVIRPEPRQALCNTDLGVQCSPDSGFGFVAISLLECDGWWIGVRARGIRKRHGSRLRGRGLWVRHRA